MLSKSTAPSSVNGVAAMTKTPLLCDEMGAVTVAGLQILLRSLSCSARCRTTIDAAGPGRYGLTISARL